MALVALLAIGFAVRWNGIAWDGYASLHPDERHLFMVTQSLFDALRDPTNGTLRLRDWWFAPDSPLNPHAGERSYVYGEAPLFAGMLAGWLLGATDWFAFMPVARTLSALADTATMLAVFLGARLLAGPVNGPSAGLFAAALYGAMPSALQLANFHTVDVWLSLSSAWAMVALIALAMRSGPRRTLLMAGLAGAAIGLAMASKVTGILLLLPFGLAVGLAYRRGLTVLVASKALIVGLIAAFVVFRLLNPFAFAGPGLFGVAISDAWIADFRGLSAVTASPDFPPNWQWIAGYGPLRLLRDLALFGFGPVAAVLLVALSARRIPASALIPVATIAIFVGLTALSSVAALRYAAPALPALAILLGPVLPRIGLPGAVIALSVAAWWGSGAVRLHDGDHPRLQASQWLWSLPQGTVITNETAWDDHLPTVISLDEGASYRWPSHGGWFAFELLDITAPDTPQKADEIATVLARTDYLVLSSDRQSAVMPRLPERFPLTTAHYAALFAGQACFAPVRVFERGYPLPFLPFDDSWAQEPWRVYDHPTVRIYRRQICYDRGIYAAFLHRALLAR